MNGLQNIGNTCYFNSLIQALKCLESFNTIVDSEKSELCNAISKCGRNINDVSGIYNELNKLLPDTQKFNIGTQEDSNEIFTFLIDKLPLEVQKLFKLRYKTCIYCTHCKNSTTNDDVKTNMPEHFITTWGNNDLNKYIYNHSSILPGYKCEKCKEEKCIIVKILVRIGSIIVIVMNKYDRKEMWNYPKKITITKTDRDTDFHLKSYVEHFGSTMGGHYTSRGIRNGKVYNFNDSSVSESELLESPNTYMLFYESN